MQDTLKKCGKCKIEKPLDLFYKNRSTKDGLGCYCKECLKKYTKITSKPAKKRIKKVFNDKSPPFKRCYMCKGVWPNECFYKESNRSGGLSPNCIICEAERYRKYANERHKNKRATDIDYRLGCVLRTRLNTALVKGYKAGSAVKDLGCSIEHFRKHIESLWTEGMNWANYGKKGWHIDHIKPFVAFDLKDRDQLLQACNYKNMQPLWYYDNISKGGKIL
jgi:hypothetical protein